MSSLNDRPRLTTNAEISVTEGAEVVITRTMLQVSDDSSPTQIIYQISALPNEGVLKLNGNPIAIGSTFTQADINSNRLTYLHNGSDTLRDRFSFTASDRLNSDRSNNQVTTRVSAVPQEDQNLYSSDFVYDSSPIVSADGRFVVFDSLASGQAGTSGNGRRSVFIHDRQTGEISLISKNLLGTRANADAVGSSISADGRFVAFTSAASDLVSNDTNQAQDAFVHDRLTGQTERISISTNGTQANDGSAQPFLSADGRYVTFTSFGSNLVSGDTNRTNDVFIHDRQTRQTSRISIASNGAQGNSDSSNATLSRDGRYVVFTSSASNLVSGDTNFIRDVFVHDRLTGQTSRVSIASDGTQSLRRSDNDFGSYFTPVISADGRYIAFQSDVDNLVPNTNRRSNIYVHDRQTGETTLVSIASNGTPGNVDSWQPGMSADGRFITFTSAASNLVEGDTNWANDIFIHDRLTRQTTRASLTETGLQKNGASNFFVHAAPTISDDGRFVAFGSDRDYSQRYDPFENLENNSKPQSGVFVYDASVIASSTSIAITPVRDGASVIASTTPTFFFENADAIAIDRGIRITSGDGSSLVSATVAVENYSGQEQLNFIDQNGITGQFDQETGVLSLTGFASLTAYQTALRSITFATRSDNPAPTQAIRFQVNDGAIDSPIATRTININSFNDAPELENSSISAQTGKTVTITSAMLQVNDPDSPPEQLVYTLTRLPANGTLQRNNRSLEVNDTFTQAEIDSGELTYFTNHNSSIDRFEFTFSDGSFVSRLSVDESGNQTSGDFHPIAELTTPGVSADGRFVAYSSIAGDLVEGDTNWIRDVFVFDRETLQTTRVSIGSNGTQANSFSDSPSISADGRFVAFWSNASTLVENDTNRTADAFLHDRQTGETIRISTNAAGIQGNGGSYGTTISADGRHVTYSSFASNLVSGDTNGERDVFLFDRETRQTTRVSVNSAGDQGNGLSRFPAISGNGRYVAFQSAASNLAIGDTNNHADIFVFDRQTGQTTAVSLSSEGAFGNRDSLDPMLSADGRFVVFESEADNLADGDTNNQTDIFVHDRQTGETTGVSINASGSFGNGKSYDPTISDDGRFITFVSDASNLVAGDTNNRPDIFRYDRQTAALTRISENGTQANGGSYAPMIAPDGQSIVFYSTASNLVADDTNRGIDLFVASSRRISGNASIAIRPNQAPTLRQAIANQTATVGTALRFTLPAQTFQDADGDVLTLRATLANGSTLPSWLRFDPTTGELTGTPTQAGSIALQVTATDSANAAVRDEFELAIAAAPNPGTTNPGTTNPDTANPDPLSGQLGELPATVFGRITRRVNGTPRADRLSGGKTNDFINGLGRTDRINGGAGDDLVRGGTGRDRINGGSGNDRLDGSQGRDRLIGGRGDDRLVGGQGGDTLTGGAGKDAFAFSDSLAAQVDTITDFDRNSDLIDLRGIFTQAGFAGAALQQVVRLEQVGANTEIQVDTDGLGDGTSFAAIARLQNVNATALTARNFVIG